MTMVRIVDVKPLKDFHVELKLSTGEIVQRDLRPLLKGAIFSPFWSMRINFAKGVQTMGRQCGQTAPTFVPML